MNKALLDTDIYSEILKAVNQTVRANAIAYRKAHGVLTLSAVTLMEITQGHYQKQALRQLQNFDTPRRSPPRIEDDRTWTYSDQPRIS